MITFTILCLIMVCISCYFAYKKSDWCGWHYGWVSLLLTFGVILIICIFIIIVNRYESGKLEIKREMIVEQNKNKNELGQFERIEINKQIKEFNDSLSSYKYDRKGFFKNTVNKNIDNMEYIK